MRIDDRRVVPLILLAQAGVAAALAVLLGLWFDAVTGISTLLGGVVAVAPNALLAARLLRVRHADDAAAMLRSARVGVFGKFVLTVVLFGVIFAAVRPLSAPAVLGGFIAAQMIVLVALLIGGGTTESKLEAKS